MQKKSKEICLKLRSHGFEAFLVGGCVRDILLKKEPKDFDIVTNASSEDIESIFSKTIPVGKKFGIIIVRHEGHNFEIATFRKDSEESDGRRPKSISRGTKKEDSQRRDFTINALYYDPVEEKIIDLVNGKQDIKNKIIRFIGDPEKRIKEDFLRILRAVRFKNNLGFDYEKSIKKQLQLHCSLTCQISPERIKQELDKMIINKNRINSILDMENLGILQYIIPELIDMRKTPNSYNKVDVLEHSLKAVSFLKTNNKILIWATLFHDLGKVTTIQRRERNHYHGHQYASGEIFKKIAKRLKFPNYEYNEIKFLIENHIKFYDVLKMNFLHKIHFFDHPLFPELIQLCRADALATSGDDSDVKSIEKEYLSHVNQKLLPSFHDYFINGHDIKKILNLEDGKKIGEIKNDVNSQQISGNIKNKNEALEYIIKKYKN